MHNTLTLDYDEYNYEYFKYDYPIMINAPN